MVERIESPPVGYEQSVITSTRHRTTRRTAALIGAAALSLAAFACGEDSTDTTGAQPDAVSEDFQPDAIAGVPVPGAAEAINAPTEKDGSVAQSYEIPGRTPQQVLEEFESLLADDGWTLANGPEQVGATGYNGEWLKDGDVLEISATPFEAGTDDAVVTQFSLVLRTE